MNALVIGLGISGRSALSFLEKRSYEVMGFDDKSPIELPPLSSFSLVVISPGVRLDHPLLLKAKKAGIPIKGEAQIALEGCTQTCIGVTGTNGKTTVTKMIEHVLNRAGKPALAVGNVGTPLTSAVGGDEILVIELSSYQLLSVQECVLDVGVILNIEDDHLDWHGSFAHYFAAKAKIEGIIKEGGHLYVHESVDRSSFSKETETFAGGNEEAARLVCSHFGVDDETFFAAIASFVKPDHRLEWVAQINGASYYNDSKATNVSAVCHALGTLQKKVILLLGGQDKGGDFSLINRQGQWIDQVIVFGQAREKIWDALQGYQVHVVETLEQATLLAMDLAKEGDTVLFSPGGASFDAFRNYGERGEVYKKIVKGEKT